MRTPRLVVLASTYPASPDDGTPAFIRDLSIQLGSEFEVLVVVPMVPAAASEEVAPGHQVRRFRYFPQKWEDLADGAILENLRARPSRFLQVPFLMLAEARALRAAVRTFDPDLIHVHWLIPQGLVMILVGGGRPFVLTTLGGDLYALNGRLMKMLKGAIVRRAEAVTVMNRDMAERVRELGADPEAVHVIPMGAAVDVVRSAADGVEPNARRIAFAGRLVEKKGVGVLLEAIRSLPSGMLDELVVIGDGPLRAELEEQATGLPVRFAGQVSKTGMAEEMASASLVVFPSVPAESGDQDGLPVALLEAMAIGRCVVASRLPGIDEAIDESNGVLVTPGEVSALRQAIVELLSDTSTRQRLGDSARATVDERFSDASVGLRYRQLLGETVSKEPSRRPSAG